MYVDYAVNHLLFANAFNLVARSKIHGNGVAGGGYIVIEVLDFGEGLLQAVPLCFVLFAAFRLGEGVLEAGIILRGEVSQGRTRKKKGKC